MNLASELKTSPVWHCLCNRCKIYGWTLDVTGNIIEIVLPSGRVVTEYVNNSDEAIGFVWGFRRGALTVKEAIGDFKRLEV